MTKQYKKLKSVNDKLTLFLFEQEALVFSEFSRKLHLLNALGIYIWLQFEEGLDKEIVKKHAINNGAQDSTELNSLINELYFLFKKAVLEEDFNQEGKSSDKSNLGEEQEEWLSRIQCIPEIIYGSEKIYRILDSSFIINFPNVSIELLMEPLLAQFLIIDKNIFKTNKQKIVRMEIKTLEDKHYKITINGFLFSWLIPEKKLVSFLLDRLRKIAFYFSEHYLAAHAAVLGKNDRCFMMPASSYAGKSTLSAALFASGFSYLSDEMTILDREFRARPVPLGLGLKKGSWPILKNVLPQLEEAHELQRWDGIAIKYLPVTYNKVSDNTVPQGLDLSKERLKVSHLVFPQYRSGVEANMKPISIPQALVSLYQAGYAQPEAMSVKMLESMFEQLATIPAYEFAFDNLDEAVACLECV